jgi:hypothetical protein
VFGASVSLGSARTLRLRDGFRTKTKALVPAVTIVQLSVVGAVSGTILSFCPRTVRVTLFINQLKYGQMIKGNPRRHIAGARVKTARR